MNMKPGTRCFIAAVVLALAFFTVAAASSNTSSTFKTGPFNVTVDLGVPCNDTNISKPVSSETLGGYSYTSYSVDVCKARLYLKKYDRDMFDLTTVFGTAGINEGLIMRGADKDTINLLDRTINGKPGAVGYGYVPRSDETLYLASFYISAKSYCYIYIWGNETMMISALKTMHITEAV